MALAIPRRRRSSGEARHVLDAGLLDDLVDERVVLAEDVVGVELRVAHLALELRLELGPRVPPAGERVRLRERDGVDVGVTTYTY